MNILHWPQLDSAHCSLTELFTILLNLICFTWSTQKMNWMNIYLECFSDKASCGLCMTWFEITFSWWRLGSVSFLGHLNRIYLVITNTPHRMPTCCLSTVALHIRIMQKCETSDTLQKYMYRYVFPNYRDINQYQTGLQSFTHSLEINPSHCFLTY